MEITELIPSDSEVVCPDRRQWLYSRMCQLWGLEARNSTHNPCALAVSLRRSDLAKHSAADFLVVPKTDGVRYLLMLTKGPDGVDSAVMIGRDMRIYEVQLWAPDTFFGLGVLMDGELAWDLTTDTRMIYHAFDAMMIEGERIRGSPLVERLHRIFLALELTDENRARMEEYCRTMQEDKLSFIPEEGKIVATPQNNFGLQLRPKNMMSCADWAGKGRSAQLWSDSNAATDGLVFTPRKLPVYVNTHKQLFKWKPNAALTIDFEVKGSDMYLMEGDRAVRMTLLRDCPVRMTEAVDDGIYECSVTEENGVCLVRPHRLRRDKTAPNARATIDATLAALEENITIEDIRQWCLRDSA